MVFIEHLRDRRLLGKSGCRPLRMKRSCCGCSVSALVQKKPEFQMRALTDHVKSELTRGWEQGEHGTII